MQTTTGLDSAPGFSYSATRATGADFAIVLAGGEGLRLRPFVSKRFGVDRPKQYCTLWGGRSMLQCAIDRALCLVPPENIVTVIANGHEEYLDEALTCTAPGLTLSQPANKGTLSGVLLGLCHVLESNPGARVLILPSDHYIHPEQVFLRRVRHALRIAAEDPERVVLLGAVPDHAESDYGWIEPMPLAGNSIFYRNGLSAVGTFYEKPSGEAAERLLRCGWLWNTMVTAANGELLWNLGHRFAKPLATRFETYREVLRAVTDGRAPPEHMAMALGHIYEQIEEWDFARTILENASRRSVVLALDGVFWSDCGRPDRLVHALETFEASPA